MKRSPKFLKFSFFATLLSFIAGLQSYAQMQPGIPKPRGPVDLSDTSNLVIFIILPILVIIGYFFWRKAMKKRKEEEDNQQ
ncbi:hypothetical protein [Cyclobacterium jeungdonense]|uniref:Adenylosuccinate synthetase n=1 Tax=Cyclobacterium jeungdonense TaxID=708087 RepID=A0ABT8CE31_9BACT|nr:hypothetical protein [Cyclobacterium jeungdonense]MDN3690681.1 hypothetical protein [Cyclobacterium jeungdonense]